MSDAAPAGTTIEATGPSRRPTPPPLPWGYATLLSVAVALWISIGEVDHLVAQVLDPARSRTWSLTEVTSVGSVFDREATAQGLQFFDTARTGDPETARQLASWTGSYAALDCLLALLYSAIALLWLRRPDLPPERSRPGGGLRSAAAALLAAGGGADVLENLLLAWSPGHASLIMAATATKWALLGAGTGLAAYVSRTAVRRTLRQLPRALYTHRYSVLVVLPLAALGLGRGPDILEQIPDIQRRWVGEPRDLFAAGAVMGLLCFVILVIGRQRTDHLLRRVPGARAEEDEGAPLLRLWFLGPAVLVAAGLLLPAAGGEVVWSRLLVFAAVPTAIGLLSLLLKHHWVPEPVRRPAVPRGQWESTSRTGDALVALLPVIAGLGALRAFTGVRELTGLGGSWWIYVFAGWAPVLVTFPAAASFFRWLERRGASAARSPHPGRLDRLVAGLTPGLRPAPPAPRPPSGRYVVDDRVRLWFHGFREQPAAWLVLTGGLAAMALVASHPVGLADSWGVIATFQLALGSLAAVVAACVILVQRREGPELFWRLGLPYAPVTGLLVATCLAITLVGKETEVHEIRAYSGDQPDTGPAARPDLSTLFDSWLAAGSTCDQALGDSRLAVRPLMLVAAEGGGIRAAYWTAAGMDRISLTDDAGDEGAEEPAPMCRGAFLSSGASGGSVGLSIASLPPADGSPDETATDRVRSIAGPQALGAASDGLVLRDTIYAAAGLGFPSLGEPDESRAVEAETPRWRDRATLIEESWERHIPQLRSPWIRAERGEGWLWGPTGALVVNSTATTNACRALVSQVQLPSSGIDCAAATAGAPGSIDLVQQCTRQLATSTAALLTARFPYVTPSGVVTCPAPPVAERLTGAETAVPAVPEDGTRLQIVDGGYGDNTGVGTLVDLAPTLMAKVRAHNTCVLQLPPTQNPTQDPTQDPTQALPTSPAIGCGGAPRTLVVPLLVYLDNGSGSDLVEKPGDLALEVLVPPITLLGAKSSLVSAASQLQRATDLLDTQQLWDPGVEPDDVVQLADRVTDWRGASVYVVLQATKPGIAAPLGWVLSRSSMDEMDKALSGPQQPLCRLDTGTLDELLVLLDPTEADKATGRAVATATVARCPD